jgi:hypothetical protein
MGGTTVALVGMPVTEVVVLYNSLAWFISIGGKKWTNPVVEAGVEDAIIGELLLEITAVLLLVVVVLV